MSKFQIRPFYLHFLADTSSVKFAYSLYIKTIWHPQAVNFMFILCFQGVHGILNVVIKIGTQMKTMVEIFYCCPPGHNDNGVHHANERPCTKFDWTVRFL